MEKKLKIYYTSDIHGHVFPVNYGTGVYQPTGLIACGASYQKDGNTLIIDGGDTIQGSPFTMYNSKKNYEQHPIANVLNLLGYDYVTLGNHDFNYGEKHLANYLHSLQGKCLCGNVIDKTGEMPILQSHIKVLENGLRVGLVGIVTDYVNVWERPENKVNLHIIDPIEVAKRNLEQLRDKVDVTICIYHGGFECNLETGERITETTENVGYRICTELDFDLLLTAHQHMLVEGREISGTYIVQPRNNGVHYFAIEGTFMNGQVKFTSEVRTPTTNISMNGLEWEEELEVEVQKWLDEPVGHFSQALLPKDKVEMALHGSSIADFFNQVQLAVSGADISCTCLANDVKGFEKDVSVRDVVSTYIFPNTLCTIEITGDILKQVLERTSSYLELDENGQPKVSEAFLVPKVEHYNYDFFAGITYQADLRKPVGERVSNIRLKGKGVQGTDTFTLCMNNYRATGAGGYKVYKQCPVVKEEPIEVSELLINYLEQHKEVTVEKYQVVEYLY